MSGRTIVADKLRAALPGWLIHASARQLDSIQPKTAVVWSSTRRRFPTSTHVLSTDTVEVWVFTSRTDNPTTLEDILDELMTDVARVIETEPDWHWEEADRGVLSEQLTGWHFTITLTIKEK